MKRLFDFFCALTGLLVLSPLCLGVSLIILLTDGGPIFFKQQRVGRNGGRFLLLKFRSMSVLKGAEAGQFDTGGSSRVTPFGAVMRKCKLDELPQLWNVIKGDMSLVGPRPEVRKWVEAYPERWERVLRVRPGITDPASIRFRNEEELLAGSADPEAKYREVILPQKLSMYEDYVERSSMSMDFVIILKTIQTIIQK